MKLEHKLTEWLGKSLNDLTNSPLFIKTFEQSELEEVTSKFYLGNTEKGIELVFDLSKTLIALHLFLIENENYMEYESSTPGDLKKGDTKSKVHLKLKSPNYIDEESKVVPILGKINPWMRFDYENCYIRLEFQEDSLSKITLGITSN